jgi:hypothetical protein
LDRLRVRVPSDTDNEKSAANAYKAGLFLALPLGITVVVTAARTGSCALLKTGAALAAAFLGFLDSLFVFC